VRFLRLLWLSDGAGVGLSSPSSVRGCLCSPERCFLWFRIALLLGARAVRLVHYLEIYGRPRPAQADGRDGLHSGANSALLPSELAQLVRIASLLVLLIPIYWLDFQINQITITVDV
jgi:hypothetical protein